MRMAPIMKAIMLMDLAKEQILRVPPSKDMIIAQESIESIIEWLTQKHCRDIETRNGRIYNDD